VEGSLYAKTQLDSCTHFDTIPAGDRRTDRRTCDDSVFCASIASRGKKQRISRTVRNSDAADRSFFAAVSAPICRLLMEPSVQLSPGAPTDLVKGWPQVSVHNGQFIGLHAARLPGGGSACKLRNWSKACKQILRQSSRWSFRAVCSHFAAANASDDIPTPPLVGNLSPWARRLEKFTDVRR